jgi:hypothetical protein
MQHYMSLPFVTAVAVVLVSLLLFFAYSRKKKAAAADRARKVEDDLRLRQEEEDRPRKEEEARLRKAEEERLRKEENDLRLRKTEEIRLRKAEEERLRKEEEDRKAAEALVSPPRLISRHAPLNPCTQAADPRSITHNGYWYKSLADHDPHSAQVIDERGKLYNLDPSWHLCPNTADALHVCATHPWQAHALIFADGSAHWTLCAPEMSSSFKPGGQVKNSSCLKQTGGKYEAVALQLQLPASVLRADPELAQNIREREQLLASLGQSEPVIISELERAHRNPYQSYVTISELEQLNLDTIELLIGPGIVRDLRAAERAAGDVLIRRKL